MACLKRQLLEILRLRPAVALAKRMDVIDITDDDAGLAREFIRAPALQEFSLHQTARHVVHSSLNVASELKLMAAFADLDRAQLACPIVDVLKQVAVNGAEMSKIERPDGYTFRNSISHQAALDSIKPSRIRNAKAITKDFGAGNEVWINVVVHLTAAARACARIYARRRS